MTIPTRPNMVNAALGLCLVALGILLLLQKAGFIEMEQLLQLWPVALILLGGAVVWEASRGGVSTSRVPMAGLVWLVLLGSLFSYVYERRSAAETGPAGQLELFEVMGRNDDPGPTGPFKGARLTAVMGGVKLNLRNAALAPGETVIVDVFTCMGGIELLVPSGWQVDVQTTSIMGGVNDARSPRSRDERNADDAEQDGDNAGSVISPDGQASATATREVQAGSPPRVVIQGTVLMGGLNIKN